MADVLIRGMEMPRSCEDCPLVEETENFYGDTMLRVCNLIYKGYTSKAPKGGRLSNCPLIPLPAGHGRLIDADAIEYTYTTARGNDDGHNWRIFAVGQDEIDDMPTIVPAEGGGEDG